MRIRFITAAAVSLLASTQAHAHHAMGGEMPSTFGEGFISGLAHPVIGLDHLAFIVAAGVIAGVAGLGLFAPLAFVAASILGVVYHLQAWDLPAAELVIAASVVLIGLILAARGGLGQAPAIALFAVAGLVHGYAYGESIVGAETTPLVAYLAGLAIIQSLIAVGTAWFVMRSSWQGSALQPRMVGAAVFGVGLSALVGQLAGA
jgi:urease accessory protein